MDISFDLFKFKKKHMIRRNFIKTGSISLLALGTYGFTSWPKNTPENLRLGGPVLKNYHSPEEWIQLLRGYGYHGAYCPVGLSSSQDEIKRYESAAKQNNIIIAEVGAWSNPISPDRKTAEEAFVKCTQSLHLAEEIGAKCCVNIAGSKNAENWAGPHQDNFSEETFDQIVATTQRIIDEVNPSRTYFTLEAMPWIFPESPDSYLRLIKAIDRKSFGVHLDPVNMVTSPAVFFRNGDLIEECFKKLGPYIKSCHAKDLILRQNTFMPQFDEVIPGQGNMNYRVFLKEVRKIPDLPLMMEHLNTEEEYHQGAEFIRGVWGI
jgi:sugar phosphate isomerase/epimerase